MLMDRNVSRASVSATDFFEQANRLTNLHSLIVVVAPKDVVQASKKMFGAALVRGMERANAKEPDIDVDADKSVLENYLANHSDLKKLGERDQEFNDAYQKLVTTMRSDLLSGTKVDNFLADEAFANKALS